MIRSKVDLPKIIAAVGGDIDITELEELYRSFLPYSQSKGWPKAQYERYFLEYIHESVPSEHYNAQELVAKVDQEYGAKLSIIEVDYLRDQFYKKFRKYRNSASGKFEYFYDEDFYQLLLEKKVRLCTAAKLVERLNGYQVYSVAKEDVEGKYREQYEALRQMPTRRYSKHQSLAVEFYYGEDFFKFLYEELSEWYYTQLFLNVDNQ